MFKLSKKISSKFLLIGMSFLNLLILISLVFYLLLGSGVLNNIFYIVAFPIDYLSNNYFVLISLFLTEILIVVYSWYKSKKSTLNHDTIEEAVLTQEIGLSNFEIDAESLNQSIDSSSQNQMFSDENDQVMDNIIDTVFASLDSSNQIDHNSQYDETDDIDFSPSHFSTLNEMEKKEDVKLFEITSNTDVIEVEEEQKKKPGVNDYQYAFYQNIVNEGWLYEKSIDRDRVGFERYALDEAKITLTDIENLISTGMLYKQIINHPTGNFVVYSSRLDIEKFIIKETIRRIIRKKRLKFVGRKFEFINWQEFGLAKKIWEFDFEIAEAQIIGCIWINNAFLASDSVSNNSALTQEKKEELKALIAASTLKMKDEGNTLIITNTKENAKIANKFAKKTGWGAATVINFSDSNFERKFSKIIDDNI